MPLRDHFHPQFDNVMSWDGFHGQWPAMIVLDLSRMLPQGYVAAPQIHLGTSIEIEIDLDEYEVRVYDTKGGRRLVAAVEIVSPANKDRPEHRRAFVAKCAALLQDQVSIAIIDFVTTRDANLYRDLLDLIGKTDPALTNDPPPLYAAACRWAQLGDARVLESWMHPLTLGQALPTLPLWLDKEVAVPLKLEASYEETCRVLQIPPV